MALAMAEDGVVLGSHWCSHEGFVPIDLGEGAHPARHEAYSKHYPGGYEIEIVRAADIPAHEGLMRAYGLNQIIRDNEGK